MKLYKFGKFAYQFVEATDEEVLERAREIEKSRATAECGRDVFGNQTTFDDRNTLRGFLFSLLKRVEKLENSK